MVRRGRRINEVEKALAVARAFFEAVIFGLRGIWRRGLGRRKVSVAGQVQDSYHDNERIWVDVAKNEVYEDAWNRE